MVTQARHLQWQRPHRLFDHALALGGARGVRRRVLRLGHGCRRRNPAQAEENVSAALKRRNASAHRAPGLLQPKGFERRSGDGQRQLRLGRCRYAAQLLRCHAAREGAARRATRGREAAAHAAQARSERVLPCAGGARLASASRAVHRSSRSGSWSRCQCAASPQPAFAATAPRRACGAAPRVGRRAQRGRPLRCSAHVVTAHGAAQRPPGARRRRVCHAARGQRGARTRRPLASSLSAPVCRCRGSR